MNWTLRIMADAATSGLLAGAALANDKPEAGQAPLKIELPKPMFEGTPQNMPGVRLDPQRKSGKRPAIMAPTNVALLSRGKPVKGDEDSLILGELEMITDGDKDAQFSFVEFFPGVTPVVVDLEKPAKLHTIVIWHYHKDIRVYRDVIVQASNDPEFKEGVVTLYNNDHDNSAELGKGDDWEYIETYEGHAVPAKDTVARYVRCVSQGNTIDDSNHVIEIEVYGTFTDGQPADAPKADKIVVE